MRDAEAFGDGLEDRIGEIADDYEISIPSKKKGTIIRWLIRALKSKFNSKVSILVDEFDYTLPSLQSSRNVFNAR